MNELSHTLFEVKSRSTASDNWNRIISGAEIDTVSEFFEGKNGQKSSNNVFELTFSDSCDFEGIAISI